MPMADTHARFIAELAKAGVRLNQEVGWITFQRPSKQVRGIMDWQLSTLIDLVEMVAKRKVKDEKPVRCELHGPWGDNHSKLVIEFEYHLGLEEQL